MPPPRHLTKKKKEKKKYNGTKWHSSYTIEMHTNVFTYEPRQCKVTEGTRIDIRRWQFSELSFLIVYKDEHDNSLIPIITLSICNVPDCVFTAGESAGAHFQMSQGSWL